MALYDVFGEELKMLLYHVFGEELRKQHKANIC